jgi:RHS repeat-associated protein
MEKDDEVKGSGNSFDYGARLYDTRLGKWLAIDNQFNKYPNLSPYNFVADNPLYFIDPDGNEIVVPNVADRAPILKMINSKAAGTFGFDKNGKLYVVKKEGSKGFSEYYRDKLIEGINVKGKTITISITNNPNVPTGAVAKDGKTIVYDKTKTTDLDKTQGGGTTYGGEGTNADVFVSGNEYKGLKDTKGKPLEDKPADIVMHELVTHAVPIITGNDQGNAVVEENKVRAQYPEGKQQQRAAEKTEDHPLCKGCKK